MAMLMVKYMKRFILLFIGLGALCFSTVLFSPNGGIRSFLVETIQSTKPPLSLAIYSFTSKELALALISEAQKGRTIRLIVDRQQLQSRYSKAPMVAKYFAVRVLPHATKKRGSMHHKFLIAKDQLLITGSYNWSNNAEYYNQENLLTIDDKESIQAYQDEFEQLWELAEPLN
jgi:phosphatidylserine/phosphatidylglycerophosphate/cardiolipin synthase-like enzyme